MATRYTRSDPYEYKTAAVTGNWDDRHKSSRIKENIWQQSAIGNIEDFLSNVQWDDLGGNTSRLDNLTSWNQDRINEIGRLEQFNKDRLKEIQGINKRTDDNTDTLAKLKKRLDNWNTTTQVSDVPDIESTLENLLQKYNVATKSDITSSSEVDLSGYLTDEDLARKGFLTDDDLPGPTDLSGYMKTTDFNERMRIKLDALKTTLRGEWAKDIPTLDLSQVNQDIAAVGGDLSKLTSKFAGLSSNVDWLKNLDLGGLETSIASDRRVDLTNLKDIIKSDRREDLRNLQDTIGRDRTADLLDLRQKIDADRLSDTEALAGNLRHEFGKQIFDLSDTYDQRLGDLQSSLGGDISELFTKSGDLDSGIAALTSGLGTTSQQLEALRDSFSDYKTDAATNLENVRSAFSDTVGDLGTDFTARLSDLGSSTAQDILGAREASVAGDESLRKELTDSRQKAISDLDTSWSGRLSDTESRFTREQEKSKAEFDKRLSDISSSLNYKTLDDSAQGVKIRRSRAYQSGRTRRGTSQLGRSMKLSTLNI